MTIVASVVGMVRAGEKAHLYDACIDKGFVTIGWFHTLHRNMSAWKPEDVLRYMAIDYPIGGDHEHRDGTTSVWTPRKVTRDANQISLFLFEMDVGQLVTVASTGTKELAIGVVTKRYEFREASALGRVQQYPYLHFKLVNWLGTFSCKDMSDRLTRYILNRRYQTVFMYDEDCASEIVSVVKEA